MASLAGMVAAACAPSTAAPPRLVAAWPSAGASLPVAPHTVELTFNRRLREDLSWATVMHDDDGSPTPTDARIEPSNPRQLKVRLEQPTSGQYRLHWHAVAADSAAGLDGDQYFSMQDESMLAPRLELSQARAESGDKLDIVGKGFGRDCAVRLSIGDDEQSLDTVETDAEGGFVVETHVPLGVSFGMQPVSAVDAWGDSATSAVEVRWGGWPPLVAFSVGQPGPGPGEVTFSLSVRNRSDYVLEKVRIVLADPQDATLIAAQPSPQRQESGLAWEIASLDRGVVGPFRATYRVSGVVASHTRIEFRHRRPRGCTGDDCLPAFVSETISDSPPAYPAR